MNVLHMKIEEVTSMRPLEFEHYVKIAQSIGAGNYNWLPTMDRQD